MDTCAGRLGVRPRRAVPSTPTHGYMELVRHRRIGDLNQKRLSPTGHALTLIVDTIIAVPLLATPRF